MVKRHSPRPQTDRPREIGAADALRAIAVFIEPGPTSQNARRFILQTAEELESGLATVDALQGAAVIFAKQRNR